MLVLTPEAYPLAMGCGKGPALRAYPDQRTMFDLASLEQVVPLCVLGQGPY